jgi:hypothetical protein
VGTRLGVVTLITLIAIACTSSTKHTRGMTITDRSSPIEVWLTQKNMTVTCRVVHEDESTEDLDIASLSMRGAQREITGWLLKWGYKPDGRWTTEEEDDQVDYGPSETVRRFKFDKVSR